MAQPDPPEISPTPERSNPWLFGVAVWMLRVAVAVPAVAAAMVLGAWLGNGMTVWQVASTLVALICCVILVIFLQFYLSLRHAAPRWVANSVCRRLGNTEAGLVLPRVGRLQMYRGSLTVTAEGGKPMSFRAHVAVRTGLCYDVTEIAVLAKSVPGTRSDIDRLAESLPGMWSGLNLSLDWTDTSTGLLHTVPAAVAVAQHTNRYRGLRPDEHVVVLVSLAPPQLADAASANSD